MSDEDYIPASKRPADQGLSAYRSLAASHAVADAVMRDLAEALRDLDCACRGHVLPCRESVARSAALARYDALSKETR
jgi:hypothetical protein